MPLQNGQAHTSQHSLGAARWYNQGHGRWARILVAEPLLDMQAQLLEPRKPFPVPKVEGIAVDAEPRTKVEGKRKGHGTGWGMTVFVWLNLWLTRGLGPSKMLRQLPPKHRITQESVHPHPALASVCWMTRRASAILLRSSSMIGACTMVAVELPQAQGMSGVMAPLRNLLPRKRRSVAPLTAFRHRFTGCPAAFRRCIWSSSLQREEAVARRLARVKAKIGDHDPFGEFFDQTAEENDFTCQDEPVHDVVPPPDEHVEDKVQAAPAAYIAAKK